MNIVDIFDFLNNPHSLTIEQFSGLWKNFHGSYENMKRSWIDEDDASILEVLIALDVVSSRTQFHKNKITINGAIIKDCDVSINQIDRFIVHNTNTDGLGTELTFWVIKLNRKNHFICWY